MIENIINNIQNFILGDIIGNKIGNLKFYGMIYLIICTKLKQQ